LTPATQSASDRQLEKQVPLAASQPNGAQIVWGPASQRPAPSQTCVPMTAAPWQAPAWQTDPAG
jgi:hypothetical protein